MLKLLIWDILNDNMTIKKLVLTTSILAIVLFIIGWIISRPIINGLTDYLMILTSNSQIVATKMSEQFRVHLLSSISFGLLPIFSFLTILLLSKAKRNDISFKGYLVNLTYITIGFIIGGLIRILLLARMVKSLDNQDFPHLINTFPLRLVKFHDWGIIVALIVSVMIYLLTKKSND